jgi:hypothetical protein
LQLLHLLYLHEALCCYWEHATMVDVLLRSVSRFFYCLQQQVLQACVLPASAADLQQGPLS